MINTFVNFLVGKDIILYDKHRQTNPLATNTYNKKKFLFFDVKFFWGIIPFKTNDKRKHKIMHLLLNCIRPKYIISMNWLTQRESLYKVWTAKHPKSKFIVVQHGSYVGGTVVDVPHRYTKCDIFWVWGNYFEKLFKAYNKGKSVEIVSLGNPVYNIYDRRKFDYKNTTTGKLLLLPTALDEFALVNFYQLLNRLKLLNFELLVKTHPIQGNTKSKLNYPKIEGVHTTTGNLLEILNNNDFDFVISDHSSSLLDAVFFKNQIIFFNNTHIKNGFKSFYSTLLPNLFVQDINTMTKIDFYKFLDIKKQEKLFAEMVVAGNNQVKCA